MDIERFSFKGFGYLWFAGARLHEVAVGRNENNIIAFASAVLGPNAGEQIRKLIILVVGPLLHGVVVALGAVDRHAEKGLGGVLGEILRVLMDDEEITCAILQCATLGQNNLPDELVPRRVPGNVVSNPIVVRPHGGRL